MAPNSHSITSALSEIPPKNGSFMGSLMVHQVDISGYQWIWEPQFSDNHGNMSGFSVQLITITIFRQTHLRGEKKTFHVGNTLW